jgi:hypothetical protein
MGGREIAKGVGVAGLWWCCPRLLRKGENAEESGVAGW